MKSKVMITKRPQKTSPGMGVSRGKIEADETPEDCLVRELKEA